MPQPDHYLQSGQNTNYTTQSGPLPYAFKGNVTSDRPECDMCVWVHRYALDGLWWLKYRHGWCLKHGVAVNDFSRKPLDVLPEPSQFYKPPDNSNPFANRAQP